MVKSCIAVAFVILCICGCSDDEDISAGTANLTIVNNTSKYVDGIIDADKTYSYGIGPKKRETYGLPVGEGILNFTYVNITANVHATDSPSSDHIWSDTEKIRMKEGNSYEYVIPYEGAANFERLKLEGKRSRSPITAP